MSDLLGKATKKAEKPLLFGKKFQRAIIDRGALLKQLKEVKQQFERHPKPRPTAQYQCSIFISTPEGQSASTADTGSDLSDSALSVGPRQEILWQGSGCEVRMGTRIHFAHWRARVSGNKSVTLDPHNVVGEKVPRELTFSVWSIEEEFQTIMTLVEFRNLGMMDCPAPSRVGRHVSFFIQNWVKIT